MSMSGSRFPDMGRRAKGAGPFSPKAGWRVPQGEPRMNGEDDDDQPKSKPRVGRPRRKNRHSDREQPFIDPDNFRMVSSTYVPLATLFERQSTARKGSVVMTPEMEHQMRRKWILWLKNLSRLADDAATEVFRQKNFAGGKRSKEITKKLRDFCRGKGPVPPPKKGRTFHRGKSTGPTRGSWAGMKGAWKSGQRLPESRFESLFALAESPEATK